MFLANASPPSWIQRLFQMSIDDGTWTINFDRTDVNNVLDHIETCSSTEDTTQIACDLGNFVLQQMVAFRHAHDVLTVQEMAEECWGKES